MNRIRNTSQRLVEVLVFYRKKNIKLQPVTLLMPLEALLIPVNPTNSDYDGINGGTGCNFIFLLCRLLVVGPVLKWLALLLCRLLVVGSVLKWLALCMYFSVFTPLTRPLYIISSNLACSSVSSV